MRRIRRTRNSSSDPEIWRQSPEDQITLAKIAKIAKERQMKEDEIGKYVVDVAVRLHRDLGRGLLETVYEVLLLHALRRRGLQVEGQIPVPIRYEEIRFDEGFRVDLMVQNKVIVELKCVERLNNAHKKQVLTYLRLADKRLGYLLNFGAALMRDGIVRIANRLT